MSIQIYKTCGWLLCFLGWAPMVALSMAIVSTATVSTATVSTANEPMVTTNARTQLFPFSHGLAADEMKEEDWNQLSELVAELKSGFDQRAGSQTYEFPDQVATPSLFQTNATASVGIHSLWTDVRLVSKQSPPTDSYINHCAVVLNGDLANPIPQNVTPSQARKAKVWRGTIRDSVVVVNGSVDISGYIYNSIVLANGPIKLESYIFNSLVLSCGDPPERSVVDVSGGYVSRAIVAARHCLPGSARQCVIFGKTDTNDFRGASIRDWREVQSLVDSTGAQLVHLPIVEMPKPERPTSESLVRELLTTAEQTRFVVLTDYMAEFVLSNSDVQQLMEAADDATSDVRRIALWHSIRMSRDLNGRDYLMRVLAETEPVRQVEFLHSFRNPAPYDIPILTAVYQSSVAAGLKGNSPKSFKRVTPSVAVADHRVADEVVNLANGDWDRLVKSWRPPEEFGEYSSTQTRAVDDRRDEDCDQAHYQLLRWLVKEGVSVQHRIQAFRASGARTWPSLRAGTDGHSRQTLASELLETCTDPRDKALVIPEVVEYVDPSLFLGSSRNVDVIRLAAIEAMRTHLRQSKNSTAYHTYLRRYIDALQQAAEHDESTGVRQAAVELLSELQRQGD